MAQDTLTHVPGLHTHTHLLGPLCLLLCLKIPGFGLPVDTFKLFVLFCGQPLGLGRDRVG